MTDDEYDDAVERDHGAFIARDLDLEDEEATEDDLDYGVDRDPELWAQQRALIEEDTQNALQLGDFHPDAITRIIDAMGDEVAESVPESPNGTSATGSSSVTDRGGFPERE